jgi:N-acetylglutamate synthase-like GNAT family acetyltransferase
MEEIVLTPADETMRSAADRLLAGCGLVALDEAAQFPEHYVSALIDGELIGLAGVEVHGDAALLRSVAVDPEFRGEGLGGALVDEALDVARQSGAETVYLLTLTAAAYFARLGFVPVGRESAPDAVAGTREWATACPASATAMRLEFGQKSRE